MNASPIPFKVCIPSRGPARIGIAASSYAHLRQIVRYKYKVSGEFFLQQEDGTIVCDEDYFRLLEPKTTLTVIESPPRPQPAFPPLQHAASTAAVVAGYQPLCPNHCWPRASVAAVGGPLSLERKRHAPVPECPISPAKRHHYNATLPQHLYGAIHPQRTRVLSHPPLQYLHPQQFGSVFHHPGPVVQSPPNTLCHPQQYNPMAGVQPPTPTSSPSLSGMVSLQLMQNCNVAITPSVVGAETPTVEEAGPNASSSLVAQLQITSVMGNASMSPSPPKPVEPAPRSRPPPLTLVPRHGTVPAGSCSSRVQRSSQLLQLSTPPFRQARHQCMHPTVQQGETPYPQEPLPKQKSSTTIDLSSLFQPVTSTQTDRSSSSGSQQSMGTTAVLSSKPVTDTQTYLSCHQLPPQADAQTQCACNPIQELPTANVSSIARSDINSTQLQVAVLQAVTEMLEPEKHVIELDKPVVKPPQKPVMEPVVEPEKLVTEPDKPVVKPPQKPVMEPEKLVTEPDKPVMELKVVGGSSQKSTSSVCETGSSDEDEENQLRIVEHAPPQPSPKSTSASRGEPNKPLYHVPFAHSPRPRLLGDALYPIIIEGDPLAVETEGETRNVCSPDEGYSSSTSPLESEPHDFSSLLPFADYDEPVTRSTREPLENSRKEDSYSGGQTDIENGSISQAPEYYLCDDIGEEDYEEDFVMDVDVFSPTLPVSPTTPQITRDHLIPQIRSNDELGKDMQLVVRIDRGVLSSAPPLVRRLRIRKPSRRYTVSLPPHAYREHPSPTRQRQRRRHSSDPTYRPGMRLLAPTYRPGMRLLAPHKPKTQPVAKRPGEERVSQLVVSVPICRGADGRILCCDEEDAFEDSDESVTIMELLASKLEQAMGEEESRRVPEIVRLEPHYPGDSEDSMDPSTVARGTPEPTAEVAEFLTLPSVCSCADLGNCVQELSDVCNQLVCGGREGGVGMMSLEIGEEVELAEPSTDTCCSPELTGMELLNLRPQSPTPPDNIKQQSALSRLQSATTVYSEDLAAETEGELGQQWRVYSLTHNADPRLRIQTYSLGDEEIFKLSSVSGTWQLRAIQDNRTPAGGL